jgi:hypothetical protein
MKLLDKILRRNRGGHEQWLVDHPGKDSMSVPSPAPNASYDQASREKMERELAEQKAKMNK